MDRTPFCYLDHNATTPVAREVLETMLPLLRDYWGNPSSAYGFGRFSADAVETARARLAQLIHAEPRDVVFTSCGTESNNTALHSALLAFPDRRHIVTTAVEHSATLKNCQALQRRGFEVSLVPVETDGGVDLGLLEQTIRADTAVVSVMWANNETGVLFPIEEVAAICRSKGVLCHTDAVQTPGKAPINVQAMGVDYLSLSAHKLHGPKGVGMLYARPGAPFHPLIVGGQQERGRRGGTENVASIAGFGRAAELAAAGLADEQTRVRGLRDRLEQAILGSIPRVSRNGAKEPRLPNTSNLAFEGVEAEAVLLELDRVGICASSGSACTTGSVAPSHVLTAMGLSARLARGSLRFSLGVSNSDADVDYALTHLRRIIEKLREQAPLTSEAR
jgi:cysteine desulfurase